MPKPFLLLLFLALFSLAHGQCDSTEHVIEGVLITPSVKKVNIQLQGNSLTENAKMPAIGQTGELSKYFETNLFGFNSSGWLVIGYVEITKIQNDIVSVKVIEQKSEMTINGSKKNHFEKGNKVKFLWKAEPEIEQFVETNDEGDTTAIGQKLCGEKMGTWEFWLKGGKHETCEYANDLPNGSYKIYNSQNTLIEEGEYEMGKRIGQVKQYFDNGEIHRIVRFKDGMKNGLSEKWHPNGNKAYEVTFKDDVEDGPFKDYFEDGTKSTEGTYKQGKFHGIIKVFYMTGQLQFEAEFVANEKNGKYFGYFESGKVQYEGSYQVGKRHGSWTEYYENGNVAVKSFYQKGMLHGAFTSYHENGQLHEQGNHENDTKDGEWLSFYEDGKPKSKGAYESGNKVGKWFDWDENGKRKKTKH